MPEIEIAGKEAYVYEHKVKEFKKIPEFPIELLDKSCIPHDALRKKLQWLFPDIIKRYNEIVEEFDMFQEFMRGQQDVVKSLITENHELKKNIKILENTLEQM